MSRPTPLLVKVEADVRRDLAGVDAGPVLELDVERISVGIVEEPHDSQARKFLSGNALCIVMPSVSPSVPAKRCYMAPISGPPIGLSLPTNRIADDLLAPSGIDVRSLAQNLLLEVPGSGQGE